MIRNTDPKRDSKHLRHVITAKQASGGVFRRITIETRWWPNTLRLQKCLGSLRIQKDVFTLILLLHSRPWARKTTWSLLCVRRPTVMQRLCWNTKPSSLPRRFYASPNKQLHFQSICKPVEWICSRPIALSKAHKTIWKKKIYIYIYIYARDFKGVKTATDAFVQWDNGELNVCVRERQTQRWNMRCQTGDQRRQKKMPGELCDDTTISDADSKWGTSAQCHSGYHHWKYFPTFC